MDNKLDLLLELLREAREDIRDIKSIQIKQGEHIEQNRLNLEEHMEQTMLVRKQVELNKEEVDQRLDKLEMPAKAKELIYSWIVKIGAVAGVLVGVYQAIQLLK